MMRRTVLLRTRRRIVADLLLVKEQSDNRDVGQVLRDIAGRGAARRGCLTFPSAFDTRVERRLPSFRASDAIQWSCRVPRTESAAEVLDAKSSTSCTESRVARVATRSFPSASRIDGDDVINVVGRSGCVVGVTAVDLAGG